MTQRNFSIAFFLVILMSGLILAAPSVVFNSPPTPSDGSSQASTTATIEADISEANLDEFKFNWNSSNYTFYDDSLMLMLNFDSYSALTDFSGGGNNGAAQGGASSVLGGKYNEGYYFDGNGDYVSVTDSNIDATGSFTIELWMKPESVNRQSGVIVKDTSATNHEYTTEFQIETRTNNEVWFSMGTQTSWSWYAARSTDLIEAGNWYYVVATMSSTKSGGSMKIYINGEESGSETFSLGRRSDVGDPVVIGVSSDTDGQGSPQYFHGTIDELRIWDRALSQNEIRMAYASNLRKYDADSWEYTMTISDLSADTYYYQAFAIDTIGVSGNTDEWEFTVGGSPSGGQAPFFPGFTQVICICLCLLTIFYLFRD